MTLSRVGIPPIRSKMAGIVELDRGDDARVRSDDQEIDRKLANPVPHDVIALATLESQGPRQLNLGQHETVRECLQQAPVEDLLRLAEEPSNRLQWPWTITAAALASPGLRRSAKMIRVCSARRARLGDEISRTIARGMG